MDLTFFCPWKTDFSDKLNRFMDLKSTVAHGSAEKLGPDFSADPRCRFLLHGALHYAVPEL